jgi:hypothetical protein
MKITDADYRLLFPSMQLATHFLEVGLPYLSNFLPSQKIHERFMALGIQPDVEMEDHETYNRNYCVSIKPEDQITGAELQQTREELDKIADFVTWRVHKTMLKDKGWLGITRLVPDEPEFDPWNDIKECDLVDEGKDDRRRLVIGIMQEYVDALRRYSTSSEPHLRARFLSAYTMAHEIGHVVWAQDFRSRLYSEFAMEPYVADDELAELGSAFMSRIFGGYDPNVLHVCDDMFQDTLVWKQSPQATWPKHRHLYIKQWAIGLPYIENLLNDKTWNDLRSQKDFLLAARRELTPDINSAASATSAQWHAHRGHPEWYNFTYAGRRPPANRQPNPNLQDRQWLEFQKDHAFTRRTECDREYERNEMRNRERFNEDTVPVAAFVDIDVDNLPERMIEDGVLGRSTIGGDSTGVTRVEVRYCVAGRKLDDSVKNTKKRPRSGDEDDEDDVERVKRQRGSSYDPEDDDEIAARNDDRNERFGDEDYDCRNIVELLNNKTPEAVTTLTIIGAFQYCFDYGIPWRLDLPEDDIGQREQLNIKKHRGQIERIRIFALNQAEIRFAGDPHAQVAIKQAKLDSIRFYDDLDVKEALKLRSLPHELADENLQRLQECFTADLNLEKDRVSKSADPGKDYVDFIDRPDEDPRDWDLIEQRRYQRINNLPSWGSPEICGLRIHRHQVEVSQGRPISRKRINCDSIGPVRRTDDDGVEVYAWNVDLHQTHVYDLRDALYRKALFPSQCTLQLYFGKDPNQLLKDSAWLSDYEKDGTVDWKDLWVVLTLGDPEPDIKVEVTKAVYQARGLLSIGLNGGRLRATAKGNLISVTDLSDDDDDDDGESSGTSTNAKISGNVAGRNPPSRRSRRRSKSQEDSDEDMAPFEAPAYLQRQLEIADDPSRKTITELMESIANREHTLTRALQSGGGHDAALRRNEKAMDVTSGAEILDNLTDVLEMEEERLEIIRYQNSDPEDRMRAAKVLADLAGIGVDIDIGEDNDWGLAPGGKGPSLMRDLYRALPTGKRSTPPP